MEYKKKLIEVALPLQAINDACQREKSIRHGHPSTLHVYWARRPLAATRAVIFSSLVDDPSNDKSLDESEVLVKRNELLSFIAEMIKWENINNVEILNIAKDLIRKSTNGKTPTLLDPFCGAGSIPIEGQRLGLESYGSDINPLAVLITKGLIEVPYLFKCSKPVNPIAKAKTDYSRKWKNATGIADDLRYYGNRLKVLAHKKLSNYYQKIDGKYNVIGWIWARNVICPNPTCMLRTPLIKTFVLSSKKTNPARLNPVIRGRRLKFEIINDLNQSREGTITRQGGKCIFCEAPMSYSYIRSEGKQKRIEKQLIATITESKNKRYYREASETQESIEKNIIINKNLDEELKGKAAVSAPLYGLKTYKDLFTNRQYLMIITFINLIDDIENLILSDGGTKKYSNAIKMYLSFAIGRLLNQHCSLARWNTVGEKIEGIYSKQAIAMVWDFVEGNPFSNSSGNWVGAITWISKVIDNLSINATGQADQLDIANDIMDLQSPMICTDPPYYDNIMYADLSDYFYVWIKKILKNVYPELFKTIQTPKNNELVASPYIFYGDKKKAEIHFLNGMMSAAKQIIEKANPDYPVTYFYAYKQSEKNDEGSIASTGWETFLDGLIHTGYQITATWPMRTEMRSRTVASNANALASSIVIALRKKNNLTKIATRREFVNALSKELEISIVKMMESDISPVDLQQAAIGPGMAVFTRYAKVLEADGSAMTVRTALQLINAELDRIQENSNIEMDSDTRFCIQWFDTYRFEEKPYGEAETLAKAKDISVQGLVNSGVFIADSGKAKLKHWSKMPNDWDPRTDNRLTLWECTHHMVRELVDGDGQLGAAKLAKLMGPQKADEAKELAYQLYHICDKRSWAKHAGDYNTLVSNWADIKSQIPNVNEGQETLF
tara:strand:- start:503 stop:3190 length:2688 start_codon:yes stop_codon:yes gene_type:complete